MKIPAMVSDILRTSAPTLLAALSLPAPFNVIASSVVSRALEGFASPNRAAAPPPEPVATNATELGGVPTARLRLTPDEVVATVEQNASDPQFVLALRKAEDDLKRYEIQAGLRFAELELEDRKRAGDFQSSNDIGVKVFWAGAALVTISVLGMLAMIILLLFVAMGKIDVELQDNNMTVAAFGLIGTAVGFINGIAGSIVTFYWGSSQGSKEKTVAMEKQFQEFGRTLAQPRPAPPPVAPAPQQPPTVIVPSNDPGAGPTVITSGPDGKPQVTTTGPSRPQAPPEAGIEPATRASLSLTGELVPELSTPHRKFADSVEWALVPDGVSVDGGTAERTGGAPKTVTKIWAEFGDLCAFWGKRYGVPVELIVAIIATESAGDPEAERFEPHINDRSVGLMQTLVTTARDTLGRPDITGRDLRDPSLSIEAGTAYIASQRKSTLFDPPLVAAAYNAGSLRHEQAEANRWRLRCHPKGTGRHIDHFVSWFGDAMRVSAADDWSAGGSIPSFAAATRGRGQALAIAGAAVAVAAATGSGAVASTTLAVLQRFAQTPVPFERLEENGPLVRALQGRLGELGYLDPPADGIFGKVSNWALGAFCGHNRIERGSAFAGPLAQALAAPAIQLPALPQTGTWLDAVVGYMRDKDYWICRFPGCRNIVYLEGVDEDGSLNADLPDRFNDLRMVFWLDSEGVLQHKGWQATTEPGRYWTENPMDPRGAARIAFGQYGAWRVGMHRDDHEGLVQVKNVKVHRDLNKDFKRTGDKVFEGLYGINQHWGYDRPESSINRASAGCLVGRTRDGHREFMAEIKKDPRYQANPSYTFITTILPGDKVLT